MSKLTEMMHQRWGEVAGLRQAGGAPTYDKAAWGDFQAQLEKTERLLYKLANHVRNGDKTPAVKWGVQAMDLLAELRELDPKSYDERVKR